VRELISWQRQRSNLSERTTRYSERWTVCNRTL